MGDGHEFDPVREIFGQLHQQNLMLSRALVAEKRIEVMRSALEACRAWHEAERNSIGSFNDRMELCSFSEWLTRKALAAADGLPFDEEYEGVPHLIVWPECTLRRASEAEAAELVAETTRAALSQPTR